METRMSKVRTAIGKLINFRHIEEKTIRLSGNPVGMVFM